MMAWRFLVLAERELLLILQDEVDARDDEWSDLGRDVAAALARRGRDGLAVLVVSDGGGVTPAQRAAMSALLEGQPLRAGVLSPSDKVRRGTISFGWFNPAIKQFAPDEVDAWLAHVAVAPADRPRVRRELATLQARVRSRTFPYVEPWLGAKRR
jgi:hypothetical protein